MRKNKILQKVAGKAMFGAAVIACVASSLTFTGCQKESSAAAPAGVARTAAFDQNARSTGTSGGYFWSLYYTTGSASITQGSAGNFSSTYSNVGDVVVGKGWSTGSAQNIGYNIGSLSGSYNSVGIYGWTTSPLIEYYVVELGSNVNGTKVNTVSSDGHTYSFYKHQQVSQPSIQGTATFWQYLDNWGGSSTGANHTVTMANHVNNWKSAGGEGFGSYNYQILSLEAYSGKSGSINATVW